jgi:hypothetical protein
VEAQGLIRVTLVLLVAVGHLVGAPSASSSTQGAPASTYYCCCPGECHCTADCCNHGAAEKQDDRPPIMRKGAGSPAWQSQVRCGATDATLQRPPSLAKNLLPTDRGHVLPEPVRCWRRALPLRVIPSSLTSLSEASPRAPPAA